MDRATVSRIEDWDASPVAGGYAGLADLAAAEFTGAVVAGGTHLFMLNGRIVGVFDGTISAFEGAESTAYEAPDPSLPLLLAMRERGGEVRAKYYTDDTPLREVDRTLAEGGFTGYLELSENVLSGDYFVVYYGGRSLSAAFVGNEERVVTGEEAFELAADEVGIYEVRSVDLEVQDVPEPAENETAGTTGAEGSAAAARSADATDADVADADATAPAEGEDVGTTTADADADADEEPDAGVEGGPPSAEAASDAEGDEGGPDDADDDEPAIEDVGAVEAAEGDAPGAEGRGDGTSTSEPDADGVSDIEEAETEAAPEGPGGDGDRDGDEGGVSTTASTAEAAAADARPETPTDRPGSTGPDQSGGGGRGAGAIEPDERFREEERWREARTVPALDPEETELPGVPESEAGTGDPAARDRRERAAEGTPPSDPNVEGLRARTRELESALEETERERRRLAARAEELEGERDELEAERAALEERIEELEAKIAEQDARLDAQEAEISAGADAPSGSSDRPAGGGEAITADRALDQTDLFVRYRSKGKATLQTAHDGRSDREAVGENLRLETHSRFDPDGTTVDGRSFEAYLAETVEYRFVAWLVEELLYEIRETGTERGLRELYDALPRIDRAEFDGTVTSVDEEGEERRESFDVVCRDRMGKPLVVANINDSLDPATGDMMGALVEDATAAAEAHESVGAAFLVTASFFEPDALETASEATGGGFLSRDSKKSFVKLSRKGGYHLCLVEARGDDFHVAVPEL